MVEFYITNESVMDGNNFTLLVLTDHVKIEPVTGIEVFESAGTLVIEVLIPSQQPGNEKSWVRMSRGIGQHARQIVSTETDHPNSEAVSSQQSTTCGRPRKQVDIVRLIQSYAKAKAYVS